MRNLRKEKKDLFMEVAKIRLKAPSTKDGTRDESKCSQEDKQELERLLNERSEIQMLIILDYNLNLDDNYLFLFNLN